LRVQPPSARADGSIGAPVAEGRMASRPPQEPMHSTAPDAPDADGMITVQSGQSLSAIAAKYKVSTAELRQWNKLKSNQLQIGQKLRVKAPVRVHTVKTGENLGGIAAKYKVSAKAIRQKNKLANADVLPVGKELIIP
jgi:LysM repeat protein